MFELAGVLVVDPQAVQEYGTEDEAEEAFYAFDLSDFAEECRRNLQEGDHLVSVSKVVSQCDELGNASEVIRDDLKMNPLLLYFSPRNLLAALKHNENIVKGFPIP